MKKDTGLMNIGKPSKDNGIEEFHVDDALHTLMKAEEHKANPELMKHVHRKLKKKKKAITSLQQLRAIAQEKGKEDLEEMEEKTEA